MCDGSAPCVGEGGAPLTIDLHPEIRAHVDAARMEQVLVNLLSNALEYAAWKPVHVTGSTPGTGAEFGFTLSVPGAPW